MAKVQEGDKVVQEFQVVVKFKAQEGDSVLKAKDLKGLLVGQFPAHVKLVVKAVKQPA